MLVLVCHQDQYLRERSPIFQCSRPKDLVVKALSSGYIAPTDFNISLEHLRQVEGVPGLVGNEVALIDPIFPRFP